MSKLKRILACAIAMVMVLAMGVPAFAATVEVVDSDNYVADRSFKAYQVFAGDWEEGNLTNIAAGSGIDWSTDLYDALNAIDGISGVDSAVALARVLDEASEAIGNQVAKVLKDYTQGTPISVTNDTVLNDGYYIIIDETVLGENDVANAALLQVAGDKVTIRVKTDKPTIEKKIDGDSDMDSATSGPVDVNNGQVKDLVPYIITSTVPDTSYFDHYYMEFDDSVSAGLDISAIDAVGADAFSNYKVQVGTVTTTIDPDTQEETTVVTYSDMATSAYRLIVNPTARTITVQFIDVKGLDGSVLRLTYNAKINSNAEVGTTGNINTVSLKYTNSPDHSGTGEYSSNDYLSETPRDVVITYLTGIKIYKIDGEDRTALEGAEFQIVGTREVSSKVTGIQFVEDAQGTYYKLKNGAYTTTAPTTETEDRYDADSLDKKFRKDDVTSVKTETSDVKVKGITNSDGYLTFSELGAGSYEITELLAPSGYNLLTEPLTVNIGFAGPEEDPLTGEEVCTWSKTGDSASNENIVFDEASGLFVITIENNSGSILPTTGGIGTIVLYVAGGLLILGAAALLITRRKTSVE